MILDIVLLPPEEVCKKIGKEMLRLKRIVPFNFVVDNRKLKPHISLFHLKANQKDLKKILLCAENIAVAGKKIKIPDPHFHKGRKFLVAGFDLPKNLYRLHEKVVKALSAYRSGQVNLPFGAKTSLQEKYLKDYGVGNILEFFKAHITLGWVRKEEDISEVVKKLFQAKFKGFAANRFAVTQINNNNQVIKIIKEFKLR